MDKKLFDRLITALLPEMQDTAARRALVESALFGSNLLFHVITFLTDRELGKAEKTLAASPLENCANASQFGNLFDCRFRNGRDSPLFRLGVFNLTGTKALRVTARLHKRPRSIDRIERPNPS